MNNRTIKYCLLLLLTASVFADASAQRTSKKRPPAGGGTQPPTTQQQTNNNQAPSSYNPYGNTPIRVDTSGVSDDKVLKSLRNDNAFDKSGINDRTPLPYEHLRWDDALFAEKVWRELDLREKMNQTFRFEGTDDNGSQMFVSMLLKAVNSGEITAFTDDRFTTPMQLSEIQLKTTGTADTSEVRDINDPNKIKEYVVTRASFDPKTVLKLRIKEEWVFDREASRLMVRILGISPVLTILNPNGTERGSSPMFWVYYPDLRPILAKYEVYNSKNMGVGRMTWEELFESRMFSSYITKSTLDNPGNKNIRQMIKDPILALLEGENLKERIFNYEQDLWSY
ncbi:MAG: gliding motility protein GldN [Bacteroidota bacterium]